MPTKLYFFLSSLFVLFLFASCSSDDGSPRFKDVDEIEVSETTQGVISEIEEVEPGDTYKVIDEEVIDDKLQSLAIVHNLDSTIDTLTFAKMSSGDYGGRSGMRTFLLGTLAASYISRNMRSTALNPSNYKSTSALNKSKGLRSNLSSSAITRRMKVPGKGSKGYGGGRSFRSFGG